MAAVIQQDLAECGTGTEAERLFRSHYARVVRAAYRITGSMEDAEDVAQAIFLRMCQGDAAAVQNAPSYVYRAGINGALDLLRRRRRETAMLAANSSLGADGEDRELRDALRRSIAVLGESAAEMFVLRYIEGYENAEIARLLNTSRAVVAVVLYRARKRVGRELAVQMRGRK